MTSLNEPFLQMGDQLNHGGVGWEVLCKCLDTLHFKKRRPFQKKKKSTPFENITTSDKRLPASSVTVELALNNHVTPIYIYIHAWSFDMPLSQEFNDIIFNIGGGVGGFAPFTT